MSKKKRENNATNKQNLPENQENSTAKNESGKGEDNKMDSNEVRQNVYQKFGEKLTQHGNKKAEYAAEHPTASKVKTGFKIGGGILAFLAAIVAIIFGLKKKNKSSVETTEDYDYYDDDFDDPEFDEYAENHLEDTVESESEEVVPTEE